MNEWLRNSVVFAIAIMTGIYLFSVLWQKNKETELYIADAVESISKAIEKIDADCTIISIDAGIHQINFLNVKAFTGSEVGPLNLAHAQQWKGPYLYDNPTIDGIYFNLIHTEGGYYVIPGDGVRVAKGKIMGKDIVITHDTHIDLLLSPNGALHAQGRSLARKININL